MAAEWGHVLFLNGNADDQLRQKINAVRQQVNGCGRKVAIAANAYVVAGKTSDEANERVRSVFVNRNVETIAFFPSVMDQSSAAAWAELDEEASTKSSNGSRYSLRSVSKK